MKTRFAFVGFRHSHVFDLLAGVRERDDCEIVACCEEDLATRDALAGDDRLEITHTDFAGLLRGVECDVVAIGDYYARRGDLVISALRAGKHVLADKPLCISRGDQVHIEELSRSRGLSVSLQLDCRGAGPFIRLREIVRAGELGEICAIHIGAQHPLQPTPAPPGISSLGKHGGTINDIGIHAFDLVPWLTGIAWKEIVAARSWNAKARDYPHFHDGAQFMATLENGAGVLADLSYFAPDKTGSQLPHYWHITVHGTHGFAETYLRATHVEVVLDHYDGVDRRPVAPEIRRRYLADFLNELRGEAAVCDLTTGQALAASRLAIEAQKRASP